jgi:predicted phosphodiesterase
VLVAALALGGSVLGLRLAGPVTRDTALGSVSVRVEPSWEGRVDAFIPLANWGVRAAAFSGPVELHVEPRSIDRDALVRAAAGNRTILRDAERDARGLAHDALLRAAAWAVVGAAALGAAAFAAIPALRRGSRKVRLAWLAAPAVSAVVLSGAVLVRVEHTFNPAAFRSPSFYAQGAELAQLLKVADQAQEAGERYGSSVHRTIAGYAALLNAGANIASVATEAPAVLVSDLHGNALVLRPLRRLFAGRPVFFAGDFGQRGTAAEAEALVPRVIRLGRPLVAVSGNHDSRLFMRRLARAGAVVLTQHGRLRRDGTTDGRPVQRVAGLLVAGYADPLEWRGDDPRDSERTFSFSELRDGERRYASTERRLLRWFKRLPRRPDVVLVHQNGLAQGLAAALDAAAYDDRLLILTGHDHEQHVDRYGDILVVDAGTVGAGGVFGAGEESVGVAQLHIDEPGAWPRAVDLMQVEPLSGAATAERFIPQSEDLCERERASCHDDR